MRVRRFTKKELGLYDGQHGALSFIAYQGKVYDVSGSFHWQNGRHQVLHAAGADLTGMLEQAPHNADLLTRCPIVGILERD